MEAQRPKRKGKKKERQKERRSGKDLAVWLWIVCDARRPDILSKLSKFSSYCLCGLVDINLVCPQNVTYTFLLAGLRLDGALLLNVLRL